MAEIYASSNVLYPNTVKALYNILKTGQYDRYIIYIAIPKFYPMAYFGNILLQNPCNHTILHYNVDINLRFIHTGIYHCQRKLKNLLHGGLLHLKSQTSLFFSACALKFGTILESSKFLSCSVSATTKFCCCNA